MKLYVVGDIHGCYDELVELLEKVDPLTEAGDEFVFIGDYIDRGPKSKEVIDLLIDRKENHRHRHTFLRGNHEDMLMNDPRLFHMNGGHETMKSFGQENIFVYDFFENLDPKYRKFFKGTQMYYQNGRTICVHAGLNPDYEVHDQSQEFMIWDRQMVGYDGDYAGNYFVVYGHTPMKNIVQFKNQIAIDTGCVFGNKLSCVVLDPEEGKLLNTFDVQSKME